MADERRKMKCPYCGYTCETSSIGAVYCGPHFASFGPNTYPAVRMFEVEPLRPEQQDKSDAEKR